MLKRRKALIGYVTYFLGKRVARQVIKRKARRRIAHFVESGQVASTRRRRLPLIGAGLALAAGALAFITRSRR